MPEFGTLLRSQRTLAVNSPYRGPNGPLHLMIDSTASRSRVRASGTHASMGRITGRRGSGTPVMQGTPKTFSMDDELAAMDGGRGFDGEELVA